MLKIKKAAEELKVPTVCVCLYAVPGVGKTATACTAEQPLIIDFDHGIHRTAFREDSIRVEDWREVAQISSADVEAYETIVVDTVGRALDSLAAELMRTNQKMRTGAGALSLQGYGALKATFSGWLRRLRATGKDVILIAHLDEKRSGDEILERLDIQGGSNAEVYRSADAMGRIFVDGDGRNVLSFKPSETAFGKNPAGLEPIRVPDFRQDRRFFAGVLGDIKAALNASSAAAADLERERERLRGLPADPEAFNGELDAYKDEEPQKKRLLLSVAAELGLKFDKGQHAFVAQVPS